MNMQTSHSCCFLYYHLLAEVVPPLLGDVERRLSVVVLHRGVGARSQEEPEGLALILYDAVVQRSVALSRLPIQAWRVLDQKVDDVQRVAGLVRDGVVQTSLGEFLKMKQNKSEHVYLQYIPL